MQAKSYGMSPYGVNTSFPKRSHHERPTAVAALVILQLLDDDLGILAREVGRVRLAQALRAVAHARQKTCDITSNPGVRDDLV